MMFRLLKSTWDPMFIREIRSHYTQSKGPPPGKKLAWVAEDSDGPFAWFGIGEPSFKLAPRRRLGLKDARPLPLTVSLFIYRRTREKENLKGGCLLKDFHQVASQDWCDRYGWYPEHWETMVLPHAVKSKVPGASFRKSGYRSLGYTTGRTARRPAGNTHGPRVWSDSDPKLVLYRGPLARMPQ